jgi:5-formyltetrahydrofolate cyclo-ligase
MKKNEIRQIYRLRRQALNQEECDKLSKMIFTKLVNSFELKNVNMGIFLPIKEQNEPNTFMLFSMNELKDTKFFAPIVEGNKEEMIFYKINSSDEFKLGMFNIPEPTSKEKIESSNLNVLLLPLLAFDNKGFRVGYGKGFYDKYLNRSSMDLVKIGVSLFEDPIEIDDVNEFDIKMDYCVTPNQIFKFKN